MKKFFLTFLLTSTTAFAQSSFDVIDQLTDLHNVSDKTKAPCVTCELLKVSSGPILVTPQEGLAEINSGSLKFMGRDLFPGSGQNRTCVFKNDKAYVLYYNCMGNKKEAIATEIEVISFTGGITRYYIENLGASDTISKLSRSQYNGTWTVSYLTTPSPGNLGIPQLKTYKEKYNNGGASGGCWIGAVGEAQNMNAKASCYGSLKSQQLTYAPAAESFWKDPGSEWTPTLQNLRKLVLAAKY